MRARGAVNVIGDNQVEVELPVDLLGRRMHEMVSAGREGKAERRQG